MQTKRTYLLMEVFLAIAILVLVAPLIMRSPIEHYRLQIKNLEAFERQRIADWTFSEVKELLLKESICWEELPSIGHEITRSLTDADLLVPDLPVRSLHRTLRLKCRGEKKGLHGEIFRIYYITILLGPEEYAYRILVQRMQNN